MSNVSKSLYEILYQYQTRLQGVANDLGIKLAAIVSQSDQETLKKLLKELPKEQKKSVQGELKRLKEIVGAIEKIRKKSFDVAKDTMISTVSSVAQAATNETATEFNMSLSADAGERRKAREKRFCKTLTDDQLKAIIDGQGIDGATIGEWFEHWRRDDLERISRAVQKAAVEQLTVLDIAKLVRGTKENNYSDGILATTRVSAVRLARTVINGVSNNARVETIKANSDVIDGIKFVGTLDGKTCPYCASYDGRIWRGEDMASARRPPIHPNCRCTLVPYVELKDEEGNVVDVENDRPAANADFDQLAKDAYNAQAKKNGWKRRYEDLSPSTRLKYYYKAQKDFEKETGKPAYRQVDSALSFPEYFKQQPDSFKRDWLGAKRYEAYKAGKLTEKAIFAPDLAYTVSPTSLVKFVEPDVPETLAKLIYSTDEGAQGLRIVPNVVHDIIGTVGKTLFGEAPEPPIFPYNTKQREQERRRIEESKGAIKERRRKVEANAGKTNTVQSLEQDVRAILGAEVDYSLAPGLEVIQEVNDALYYLAENYGDLGTIDRIAFVKNTGRDFAQYDPSKKELRVKESSQKTMIQTIEKQFKKGHWNAKSIGGVIAHEFGHSFAQYLRETDPNAQARLDYAARVGDLLSRDGKLAISKYSTASSDEFVGEVFSKLFEDPTNEMYKKIMRIYIEDNFIDIYKELLNEP